MNLVSEEKFEFQVGNLAPRFVKCFLFPYGSIYNNLHSFLCLSAKLQSSIVKQS